MSQLPMIKARARITGDDRAKLREQFVRQYERGASIRSLAAHTGRSYGFVHRLLTEANVTLRGRGSSHGRSTRRAKER